MADTPAPRSQPPRRPSGKQRAVRIPLDYYKSRDALGRWRLVLVILAPVAALGWWYGERLIRGDRSDSRVSHGPVWAGHAMWENDCQVCHVPFEPIKSDAAFAPRGSARLANTDQRCSTCHAGPIHHANQLLTKTESCGGCHRDHRGRDADLNRVPDSQCTICHSDLPHAIQGGPPDAGAAFLDVSRFDSDHPDFAIRAPSVDGLGEIIGRLTADGPPPLDPSNLKFNHEMHLKEGIDCNFTFEDLDPEDRPSFGWTPETPIGTAVRLDCASCHLLDGGDRTMGPEALAASRTVGDDPAPRSPGTYMRPISFENHCRACHKLTVGVPEPGGSPLEVPHRMQPSDLRVVLERAFAAEALGADRSILDRPAPDPGGPEIGQQESGEGARASESALESLRSLLSESDSRLPGRRPGSATIGEAIQEKLRGAKGTLYLGAQTCTECHEYAEPRGADPSKWTVLSSNVPEIWFPHASFSHIAHRAVDCSQCHAGVPGSSTSDDILLAPISSCRDCHAPAEYSRAGLVKGGARFDCVECHRYHHGDRPTAGLGALARQVDEDQRRSIEAFLRGSAGTTDSGWGEPTNE